MVKGLEYAAGSVIAPIGAMITDMLLEAGQNVILEKKKKKEKKGKFILLEID